MSPANSLGGIVLAIAVAVVAASAVSRAQPDGSAAAAAAPELLASDLIGRPVRSPNGDSVGEIADLVLSPADTVSSAVVAVGGFFGVGEHEVEVPFDKLVVAPDRSTVLVTMSKEQLAATPEFSRDNLQRKPTDVRAVPGAADTPPAPPAAQPDPAARAEANAEAAKSFAEDDPRVAAGIAESKAAYDKDKNEASPQ
jgi:sporulation protein YlmC with PRC-barrel domain